MRIEIEVYRDEITGEHRAQAQYQYDPNDLKEAQEGLLKLNECVYNIATQIMNAKKKKEDEGRV